MFSNNNLLKSSIGNDYERTVYDVEFKFTDIPQYHTWFQAFRKKCVMIWSRTHLIEPEFINRKPVNHIMGGSVMRVSIYGDTYLFEQPFSSYTTVHCGGLIKNRTWRKLKKNGETFMAKVTYVENKSELSDIKIILE